MSDRNVNPKVTQVRYLYFNSFLTFDNPHTVQVPDAR